MADLILRLHDSYIGIVWSCVGFILLWVGLLHIPLGVVRLVQMFKRKGPDHE